MTYLNKEVDLRILKHLLSGNGVHVNISGLANKLDIHWSTAKKKLQSLYDEEILNPPFYLFRKLFDHYPLLVLVKADMPRTEGVREFYRKDPHIFAAFSCMEGFYNNYLIEYFKSLEDYHSWRSEIAEQNKIPSREERTPAEAQFFSNRLTFKYKPNCFLQRLLEEYRNKNHIELNSEKLKGDRFEIFKTVMGGDCIKTNYSYIGREINANRKTVKRRIQKLLEFNVIGKPKCFFPNLFVPPGYNLIVTLIEGISKRDEIKEYLKRDDSIPRAIETSTGRYNFLVFTAFDNIEEFFEWTRKLHAEFPGEVGAISKTILSSKMIHLIEPQKISLSFIEEKLKES